MAHRTVNAKELAKDIKDGMAYDEIKAKYHLSDRNMQKLIGQLLQLNIISLDDLTREFGDTPETTKESIQGHGETASSYVDMFVRGVNSARPLLDQLVEKGKNVKANIVQKIKPTADETVGTLCTCCDTNEEANDAIKAWAETNGLTVKPQQALKGPPCTMWFKCTAPQRTRDYIIKIYERE